MSRHAGEVEDLAAILERLARGERGMEIPFWPSRVLHQDMLGAAALVDTRRCATRWRRRAERIHRSNLIGMGGCRWSSPVCGAPI